VILGAVEATVLDDVDCAVVEGEAVGGERQLVVRLEESNKVGDVEADEGILHYHDGVVGL